MIISDLMKCILKERFVIKFLYGKEEPFKICLAFNMWPLNTVCGFET